MTTAADAKLIDSEGFPDQTWTLGSLESRKGLWVSEALPDARFDKLKNRRVIFEVDCNQAQLTDFEWGVRDTPFREWLVPAAILDSCPRRRLPKSSG